MKLASIDIEISDDLSTPGDAGFPPHIACAAIALSDKPDDVIFYQSPEDSSSMTPIDVATLAEQIIHLSNEYTFLTWNGVAFDFQVIADNAAAHDSFYKDRLLYIAWAMHIDMMLLVTFQTGYRLSLDAALAGAGLAGKLHTVTLSTGETITDMSGAKAPELWRAGERSAVLEYLREDVLQPLALAEWINANQQICWRSKKGRPMSVHIPGGCMTVQDAYTKLLPPADTGWMSDPILREPYICKYLPAALGDR